VDYAERIERTVGWYRDNEAWWGPIRSGEYQAYYERQYGRSISADPSTSASEPAG